MDTINYLIGWTLASVIALGLMLITIRILKRRRSPCDSVDPLA